MSLGSVSLPPGSLDSVSLPLGCSMSSEESNRHTDADMDLPAPVVESDGEGVASSLPSAPSERDSDSDISLPEPNGFDEFIESDSDMDSPGPSPASWPGHEGSATITVPTPRAVVEACQVRNRHALGVMPVSFAEYYSPPRVASCLAGFGVLTYLCLDTLTGWNFDDGDLCMLSERALTVLQISFVFLCPPCTAFSALNSLWNFKNMSPEKVQAWMRQGRHYLTHSMRCARIQHAEGRFFAFEHPAGASSWKEDTVREVARLPGVYMVTFDMCMVGLTSPVLKIPMRKRTRIMTNSRRLVQAFQGCMCDRQHEHKVIQDREGGVKLSVYAQRYPLPMARRIADVVQGCTHCQ